MNKLELENNKNRLLYRELFLKANENINKQLNNIKQPTFCKKCRTCCQIRYTSLSPSQIQNLHAKGDKVSSEYMKLFIPYGASEDFDFKTNNTVDIEINNKQAKKINENYVNLIIAKTSEPLYFYKCRHLTENIECSLHNNINFVCTDFPNSVSMILPQNCGYKEWQKSSLNSLNNQISKDIIIKIKEIDDYRKNFNCKMCATCCKLASSEFSYEELKEKAQNGDNFASQFTSIFVPYENIEEAKKIFPEYVDILKAKLAEGESTNFYHCPHVTQDNKCSRYEERPDICKSFPDNPLVIFPPGCGFDDWKEDVEVAAMLLHALIEICNFNIQKIEETLKT